MRAEYSYRATMWFSHQALRMLRLFVEDPASEFSAEEIIAMTSVRSGTARPLLLRFERRGLLTSRWEDPTRQRPGRRRMRLYRVTSEGLGIARKALAEVGRPGDPNFLPETADATTEWVHVSLEAAWAAYDAWSSAEKQVTTRTAQVIQFEKRGADRR